MIRFTGFLFGLFIGLLLFGVGAVFFFPRESRIDASKMDLPSVAKLGLDADPFAGKAVPEVSFEGTLDVSPGAAELLRKSGRVSINIEASQWRPNIGADPIGQVLIEDVKFPLRFSLPWERIPTEKRIDVPDLGQVAIDAVICMDVRVGRCNKTAYPRIGGLAFVFPKLKGTIASQAAGSPLKLDIGQVTANLVRVKPDVIDCVKSGYTVSGKVSASSSFLAKYGAGTRIMLVMSPLKNQRVGPPFYSIRLSEMRPITAEDMKSAASFGIAYTGVTLPDAGGAPFELKFSPGFEMMNMTYVAVVCTARESDGACAARFYPALRSYSLSYGDLGIYRLAPKDFRAPVCGSKTVFYLNNWKEAVGSAPPEAYRKASPPELVDGATL